MISEYQKLIHKSRYARYLDSEGRRETWEETVNRYCDYMSDVSGNFPNYLREAIMDMEVMPSMRALMTADPETGSGHCPEIIWQDITAPIWQLIISEPLMSPCMSCYAVRV